MSAYTQTVRLVRAATTWHVTSVQVARRNALVASTALARTRAEQREVEDYLAALDRSRTGAPTGHPVVPHGRSVPGTGTTTRTA